MTKREIKIVAWTLVVAGGGFLVAWGAGAVKTADQVANMRAQVETQTYATVCEKAALAYREETGDTTSLKGYSAREARNELAKTFVAVIPGMAEPAMAGPAAAIVEECASRLDA